MFGLIDRFFVLFRSFFPWNLKGMDYIKQKIPKNSDEIWICFLPFFSYNTSFLRKRIIPKDKDVILYIFPKIPVFPNPNKTKQFLDKVGDDASKEIRAALKRGKKVNLLFHSLSTSLIGRLSKGNRLNRIVAISPGSNLAECIWASIATKHVKEEAIRQGYNLSDFKKALKNYNPIDVARWTNAEVDVYLGRHDDMIPYEQGVRFVKELRKKKKKVRVFDYHYFGHTLTVFAFKHR